MMTIFARVLITFMEKWIFRGFYSTIPFPLIIERALEDWYESGFCRKNTTSQSCLLSDLLQGIGLYDCEGLLA